MDMQVRETGGEFWVVGNGSHIAGPFETNAAAWAWIDRNSNDGDDDHRTNVRALIDKYGAVW
jgi:hypothetical protein